MKTRIDAAQMADPETEYGYAMRQFYCFLGAAVGAGVALSLMLLSEWLGGTTLDGAIDCSACVVVWLVMSRLAWIRGVEQLKRQTTE